MTTTSPIDPRRVALLRIQAALGLVALSVALGAYDWRIGLGTFGLGALATSRFWRI